MLLEQALPGPEVGSATVYDGPFFHTLQGIVRMAARLRPQTRSALLLMEDQGQSLVAGHNLSPADVPLLGDLREKDAPSLLTQWGDLHAADVRPLLTQLGELLGVLVLFRVSNQPADETFERDLDDLCWVATQAIEQKHLSDDLVYHAHRDSVTNLWNRPRIERELDRVLSQKRGCIGLAILGLDRFRVINDVLGHHVGDELLRQSAERLTGVLESSCSIARSGGDEFVVLMPNLPGIEQASARARTLIECFRESFTIGDHELAVRATAGVSSGAAEASNTAELYSQASIALRYAKARSRGHLATFERFMVQIPPERLVMEQHLRFALEKREFQIYYQPQVELYSGSLKGVEALVRWNHPSLGFISPEVFIPLAEEIGLIGDLGDWVLEEALDQLKRWSRQGLADIRVAVNISALQFGRANFAASVAQRLRRVDIDGSYLELELTESAIMTNVEHALRQMRLLRSLRVDLAIDDFGTGHSSLAYLRTLPLNRLKVDRVFVRDIVTAEDRPPLLETIIQMGRAVKLSVIAEGVETAAQLAALRALRCDEVQGYWISRPIPGDDLLRWAKARSNSQY
jgi:diguanylate cyclase (GGDEF)-like protein